MKLQILEELSKSTPYMLRNDGKVLTCGSIHPYFKIEYSDSDEEDMRSLIENESQDEIVDWFYKNTQHQYVKETIVDFVSGIVHNRLAHESLFPDIPVDKDCNLNYGDCVDLFDVLNDELNQEFCRVRTSDFYYGDSSNAIYFRISSVDFNWFNLIWELVYDNKRWIETVTIARDLQTFGTEGREYYVINNQETLDMPIDDFLNLSGRPVIESAENVPHHIKALRMGKSLYEAFGGTNPAHLIRRYKMRVKHNMNCGFVPTNISENKKYYRVKRTLFGDPKGEIKTFAIISPENPLGWKNSTNEVFRQKYLQWVDNPQKYNADSLKRIKVTDLLHKIETTGNETLKYGGFNYVPIKGSYGNREHSFIIFNLPFGDAKQIAKNYGQESFFFGRVSVDSTKIAYYETYDACNTYELVEISNTVTYEDEAEDFFSKYGFKFKINLASFGADVKPIENAGEFEESLDDTRTFMSRAMHRRNAYKK